MVEVELEEGMHTVVVEKPGYKTLKFNLYVKEDYVKCYDYDACKHVDIRKEEGVWKVKVTLEKGYASIDDWLATHPTVRAEDVKEIVRAYLGLIDIGFKVTVEDVKKVVRRYLGLA